MIENHQLHDQLPDFAALVDAYIKDATISTGRDQNNQQVSRIATIVLSDNISLANVIEFMGEGEHKYLNSSTDSYRNRSTYLVANLIYKLNDGALKYILHPSVLHILSVFFTRRLEDLPSTLPSLYALSTLIEFYSDDFDPKYFDFIDIAEAVFKGMSVQTYAQNIRQKVFSLYDEFLSIPTVSSIFREKDYGPIVLEGLIGAMDGEKDPRCLLLALKAVGKAVRSFSYVLDENNISRSEDNLMMIEGAQTASLFASSIQYPLFVLPNPAVQSHKVMAGKIFDSVACYFPITFTPPPDDPFGVTPEALISALQDSLCSHVTLLRHHTIPFMISQLCAQDESVLSIAREHSLDILIRAVSVHRHKILLSTSSVPDTTEDSSIYSLCEILNAILSTADCSPEIRSKSLKLIMEVTSSVTTLAAKENNNYAENDWTRFNEPLLQMIRKDIMECSDGMKAKCSIEIAFCMSSVNSISCKLVVDSLLPILIEKARTCATLMQANLQKQVSAAARGINILPSAEEKISSAPLEFIGRLMTATKISGREKSLNFSNLSWGNAVSAGDRVALFSLLASNLLSANTYVPSPGTEDSAKLFVFLPSAEIISFVAESVRAMQELLLSGSSNDFSIDELAEYMRTVAVVAVYGVKKLWLGTQLTLVQPSNSSGVPNEAVSIACMNLMVALARSEGHTQLIADFVVPTLMQQYKAVGINADGFPTLSIISTVLSNVVRSSVGLSVLVGYVPSIVDSVVATLTEIEQESSISSTDNIRSLSLYLNSVASWMQEDAPADSSTDSSRSNRREKALFLLELTNVGNDSLAHNADSTRATVSSSALYQIVVRAIRIGGTILEGISQPRDGSAAKQEPIYNEFFSSLLTLIRQLLISLWTPLHDLQVDLAWPLMQFVTAETVNADKEPLVIAVLCNILVAVQNESAVFSDASDSTLFYSNEVHILEHAAFRAMRSLSSEIELKVRDFPVLTTYSSAQLLAIIANKVRVGGLLYRLVEQLKPLDSNSKPSIPHVFSFLWVMKAVCMRPSIPTANSTTTLQDYFIQQVVRNLRLFRVPDGRGEDAEALFDHQDALVVGLGLLTAPDDIILSTKFYCNSSTFWKQKLWSILASQLLLMWTSGLDLDQQRRQLEVSSPPSASVSVDAALPSAVYCAVALYSMGCNLTPQILQPNIKDLTNLVVHTLKTDSPSTALGAQSQHRRSHRLQALLQSRSLQMMQAILDIDSSAFSSHLNTIIPVLVHSAQQGPSAAQRFSAVEALLSMAQLEYPRLHPYKKSVIKGLSAALDDRKAAVRYMAAKARNKWMVLK